MTDATRTVVIWCPQWPIVAAGLAGRRAAVIKANRVVACSAEARADGVRLRQRRREAEAASPGIELLEERPSRDIRAFEAVISAISQFTPQVEVTRPGVCSLPARGPSRYFGGEEALSRLVAAEATSAARRVGGPDAPASRVGIADSPFTARLAARRGEIVPAGGDREWLAPQPVSALGLPGVTDLLGRLGVHTLGSLAAMEEGVVSARLGSDGARAHRRARGLDDDRLVLEDPPFDVTVARELEEPIESVEAVAFAAAGLAEELASRLAERGLACTRLLVEASTEHAEELSRWWRADRPFTARTMLDRVRWQLEGWLTSETGAPSAGITLVRLTVGEVARDAGRQLDLLGEPREQIDRVERAVARVQGLLGHDSIGTAVLTGGRGPLDGVWFVPWGEASQQSRRGPWPGRLPAPAPAVVYQAPIEVSLRDGDGMPVEVSGRGELSAPPAHLFVAPGREQAVRGWAGPWPSDERWWDPTAHRRRARMQVLLEGGSAHVLALEQGRWSIEASYD
jgi:protein ImuB